MQSDIYRIGKFFSLAGLSILFLLIFCESYLESAVVSRSGRALFYEKAYILVRGGSFKVTEVRAARGAVEVFPRPKMPPSNHPQKPHVSYFECKRVDIGVIPFGTVSGMREGGEVYTSGPCLGAWSFYPGTSKLRKTTPSPRLINTSFRMTRAAKNRAVRMCREKRENHESRRMRMRFEMKVPFMLKMRYCFLDMRGRKTGRHTRRWHVDCGKKRWTPYAIMVPVIVEYSPRMMDRR